VPSIVCVLPAPARPAARPSAAGGRAPAALGRAPQEALPARLRSAGTRGPPGAGCAARRGGFRALARCWLACRRRSGRPRTAAMAHFNARGLLARARLVAKQRRARAARAPVWPYAKMQTLYPSSALVTSGDTSSNTSAWLALGGKARSKSNACAPSSLM